MKRTTLIILSVLLIWSILKSNKYEVVSVSDGIMHVNRKGELIRFYDPTNTIKPKDSIRLYMDYRINYKQLIIK